MPKGANRKLPRPVSYKSVFQARYEPKLSFYNRLIPAAEQLNEFPQWETSGLAVTLFDFGKRCSVSIAHDSFSYSQDSHDIAQERSLTGRILGILGGALEIPSFKRLGLRRWYLTSIDISFESLVSILNIKLLSQDDRLRSIIPRKVDDLTYVLVSSDEVCTCRISIGPMRRSEIPKWITVDQQHHLDVENREALYAGILESYPEICVYMDVDHYQTGDALSLEQGRSFQEMANGRIEKLVLDLNEYFFSTRVEE